MEKTTTNIDLMIIMLPIFGTLLAVVIGSILTLITQKRLKIFDYFMNKKEREEEENKFYLPLLRCLYDLDDRFKRIFQNLDSDWLSIKHLELIKDKKGFAENPKTKGYFLISTVYLIGCFFGVVEVIRKRVDSKKITVKKRKHNRNSIFQFDQNITIVSRLFQHKELFVEYCKNKNFVKYVDAYEIHKHIQHSIGEMMIEKINDTSFRVKSFREFYELFISDKSFQFWFILIEDYVTNLCGFEKGKTLEKKAELKNDIRPLRLKAIQYWCRKLMQKILEESNSIEYSFENRKPEDLLDELSDELKNLIKDYKLENNQQYLSGLNISQY